MVTQSKDSLSQFPVSGRSGSPLLGGRDARPVRIFPFSRFFQQATEDSCSAFSGLPPRAFGGGAAGVGGRDGHSAVIAKREGAKVLASRSRILAQSSKTPSTLFHCDLGLFLSQLQSNKTRIAWPLGGNNTTTIASKRERERERSCSFSSSSSASFYHATYLTHPFSDSSPPCEVARFWT